MHERGCQVFLPPAPGGATLFAQEASRLASRQTSASARTPEGRSESQSQLQPMCHKKHLPRQYKLEFPLPGVSTLLSRCTPSLSQKHSAGTRTLENATPLESFARHQQGAQQASDTRATLSSGGQLFLDARRSHSNRAWTAMVVDSRPYPHVSSSFVSTSNLNAMTASKSRDVFRKNCESSSSGPPTADLNELIKRTNNSRKGTAQLPPVKLHCQGPDRVRSSQHFYSHPDDREPPRFQLLREDGNGRKRALHPNTTNNPSNYNQYSEPRQLALASSSSEVHTERESESSNQQPKYHSSSPPSIPTTTKSSRYLREMDRREILNRIARGEKQSALAKEFHVSRAAICNLNKHRDEVLSRTGENPFAKHPKKPRLAKQQSPAKTRHMEGPTNTSSTVLYSSLKSLGGLQASPPTTATSLSPGDLMQPRTGVLYPPPLNSGVGRWSE